MLSGNYDRKVTTMMNSALNCIDDDGYCGYPTARVNGFAIVMCCDDDDWNVVAPGESIKLRGTVKQHSVYNGIKQTALNRCTVKF